MLQRPHVGILAAIVRLKNAGEPVIRAFMRIHALVKLLGPLGIGLARYFDAFYMRACREIHIKQGSCRKNARTGTGSLEPKVNRTTTPEQDSGGLMLDANGPGKLMGRIPGGVGAGRRL